MGEDFPLLALGMGGARSLLTLLNTPAHPSGSQCGSGSCAMDRQSFWEWMLCHGGECEACAFVTCALFYCC